MPLTRAQVSVELRVMLPAFTIGYVLLGVTLLVQGPRRTSTDVFDAAKQLLPIDGWALVFLTVGACMVTALATHRRRPMMWALQAGTGLCTFWAVLLFASAVTNPAASFTSTYWVAGVAVAQFAAARGLATGAV